MGNTVTRSHIRDVDPGVAKATRANTRKNSTGFLHDPTLTNAAPLDPSPLSSSATTTIHLSSSSNRNLNSIYSHKNRQQNPQNTQDDSLPSFSRSLPSSTPPISSQQQTYPISTTEHQPTPDSDFDDLQQRRPQRYHSVPDPSHHNPAFPENRHSFTYGAKTSLQHLAANNPPVTLPRTPSPQPLPTARKPPLPPSTTLPSAKRLLAPAQSSEAKTHTAATKTIMRPRERRGNTNISFSRNSSGNPSSAQNPPLITSNVRSDDDSSDVVQDSEQGSSAGSRSLLPFTQRSPANIQPNLSGGTVYDSHAARTQTPPRVDKPPRARKVVSFNENVHVVTYPNETSSTRSSFSGDSSASRYETKQPKRRARSLFRLLSRVATLSQQDEVHFSNNVPTFGGSCFSTQYDACCGLRMGNTDLTYEERVQLMRPDRISIERGSLEGRAPSLTESPDQSEEVPHGALVSYERARKTVEELASQAARRGDHMRTGADTVRDDFDYDERLNSDDDDDNLSLSDAHPSRDGIDEPEAIVDQLLSPAKEGKSEERASSSFDIVPLWHRLKRVDELDVAGPSKVSLINEHAEAMRAARALEIAVGDSPKKRSSRVVTEEVISEEVVSGRGGVGRKRGTEDERKMELVSNEEGIKKRRSFRSIVGRSSIARRVTTSQDTGNAVPQQKITSLRKPNGPVHPEELTAAKDVFAELIIDEKVVDEKLVESDLFVEEVLCEQVVEEEVTSAEFFGAEVVTEHFVAKSDIPEQFVEEFVISEQVVDEHVLSRDTLDGLSGSAQYTGEHIVSEEVIVEHNTTGASIDYLREQDACIPHESDERGGTGNIESNSLTAPSTDHEQRTQHIANSGQSTSEKVEHRALEAKTASASETCPIQFNEHTTMENIAPGKSEYQRNHGTIQVRENLESSGTYISRTSLRSEMGNLSSIPREARSNGVQRTPSDKFLSTGGVTRPTGPSTGGQSGSRSSKPSVAEHRQIKDNDVLNNEQNTKASSVESDGADQIRSGTSRLVDSTVEAEQSRVNKTGQLTLEKEHIPENKGMLQSAEDLATQMHYSRSGQDLGSSSEPMSTADPASDIEQPTTNRSTTSKEVVYGKLVQKSASVEREASPHPRVRNRLSGGQSLEDREVADIIGDSADARAIGIPRRTGRTAHSLLQEAYDLEERLLSTSGHTSLHNPEDETSELSSAHDLEASDATLAETVGAGMEHLSAGYFMDGSGETSMGGIDLDPLSISHDDYSVTGNSPGVSPLAGVFYGNYSPPGQGHIYPDDGVGMNELVDYPEYTVLKGQGVEDSVFGSDPDTPVLQASSGWNEYEAGGELRIDATSLKQTNFEDRIPHQEVPEVLLHDWSGSTPIEPQVEIVDSAPNSRTSLTSTQNHPPRTVQPQEDIRNAALLLSARLNIDLSRSRSKSTNDESRFAEKQVNVKRRLSARETGRSAVEASTNFGDTEVAEEMWSGKRKEKPKLPTTSGGETKTLPNQGGLAFSSSASKVSKDGKKGPKTTKNESSRPVVDDDADPKLRDFQLSVERKSFSEMGYRSSGLDHRGRSFADSRRNAEPTFDSRPFSESPSRQDVGHRRRPIPGRRMSNLEVSEGFRDDNVNRPLRNVMERLVGRINLGKRLGPPF